MKKVLDFIKNMFLDVFASVSGFFYGFIVVSLGIVVITAIIYLFLFTKNLIM
ncbi:hypothetical protein [Cytobacillus sp. IB215665]|uniref:hypothetical protein n=1 Tax=Cytobacillus sp. IB215665 TaxID=3097357 RepID=UPI002A14CBC0|nr:hypothetical protein [Cytobacillus sp. IB215665]MDX8367982.1 hypothetical protein [Cytobacillus sp. IB215665]